MEGQTAFTAFLNHHFAALATQILHAAHVTPHNPQAPISNSFAMEILILGFSLIVFLAVRFSLSVEKPGTLQQIAEMIHGFVSDQAGQIIGHGGQRYVMYTTCVLMFVLIGNLMGLIPGLVAPTAKATVTLGLASLSFLYYHYHGVREQKLAYWKQFVGPIWWIAWMMLPIEIISHIARILSLSVRLYANMFAGDMVYLVWFSLVPAVVPIALLVLHLLVSVIQAYIFMLLTMIYVSQAVSHEH